MTSPRRLFAPGSWPETRRIADVLRQETVGGLLLLVSAALALGWANSPWSGAYVRLRDAVVGPAALHLDLSVGAWAADGLLAVFFFVAGLELKREFVAGDLRDPRRAALPVAAAVGGMVVPAGIYAAVNLAGGGLRGWAVPTATDIAFALAVLAVISTHLPAGLRTFLLALAVVDDLLAITVIAIFYTAELHLPWLLLALLPLAAFGAAVRRGRRSPWLLLPLAATTWALIHASGVHATVAGALLAFTVPVAAGARAGGTGLAEHFEHLLRPVSAGLAVPVFAFTAAGVTIGGFSGLADSLQDRVALGIVAGLVVGKAVGITGATWLVARFTRSELDAELGWPDVVGVSMLGGIGFTVSLLIGELAFGAGTVQEDHTKVGVLVGTLASAVIGAGLLRLRARRYRRMRVHEEADADRNGVPDVFEPGSADG
jgi:NhaA family Na+:H+ antiporter